MTAPTSFPLPQEIRLSSTKDLLTISFDTGDLVTLPAELLRVESPSAEVQGHAPDQKRRQQEKAMSGSRILNPLVIMRCALRLTTAIIRGCSAGLCCLIMACAKTN